MARSGLLSPRFVGSEEFTVAVVTATAFVGIAVPLLLACVDHLSNARILAGCSVGLVGLLVAGLCLWKFGVAVASAHRRYAPDVHPMGGR